MIAGGEASVTSVQTCTVTVPFADTHACGAAVLGSKVPAAEATATIFVLALTIDAVPRVHVSAVELAVIDTVF